MPPEIGGWILDGGVPGILLAIIAWLVWDRTEQKKECKDAIKLLDDERKAHNATGLLAAREMYDQKLLNQSATSAIELANYRITDLTKDLEKCERTVERWQSPPRPEAAS